MSANIIPFSVRQSAEWPDGALGDQLERVAQALYSGAKRRGKDVSIEKARRAALETLQTTPELGWEQAK